MEIVFSTFILLSSIAFCVTKSELEQAGHDKLNDWFEHAGIGVVEVGVGAFQFYRGDFVGGAAGVGLGIKDIKDSIKDFNEAKSLFAKSREESHD